MCIPERHGSRESPTAGQREWAIRLWCREPPLSMNRGGPSALATCVEAKVQKGRYLYCPNGSHMALYDDQKVYMDGVIRFITDVDAGRF